MKNLVVFVSNKANPGRHNYGPLDKRPQIIGDLKSGKPVIKLLAKVNIYDEGVKFVRKKAKEFAEEFKVAYPSQIRVSKPKQAVVYIHLLAVDQKAVKPVSVPKSKTASKYKPDFEHLSVRALRRHIGEVYHKDYCEEANNFLDGIKKQWGHLRKH